MDSTVGDHFMEQDSKTEQQSSDDPSKHYKQLILFKVKPELLSAADTLLAAYDQHDPHLKDFFDYLKKVLTQDEAGSKKTRSLFGWLKVTAPVTVKVHTVTTGEAFGADEVLMKQVTQYAELEVKQTNPRGCSICILFCPITSRPGSDVEVALVKAPGDKPLILVLMHHTRRSDYTTSGTSWSDNFPNISLHVDVLFHETVNGLLTCSQNEKAVRQIQTKLLEIGKNQ